jgi:hypothetical protein
MWHNRRVPKPGQISSDLKFSLDPAVVKKFSFPTKPIKVLYQCRVDEDGHNVSMNVAAWRWTGIAKEVLAFYVMQRQMGGRLTRALRFPGWQNSFDRRVKEMAAEKKKMRDNHQTLNPLLEAIESLVI